jgi:hypothetical protein
MLELIDRDPPPDKEADGLAWAAHMNSLQHSAEEYVRFSIFKEPIYDIYNRPKGRGATLPYSGERAYKVAETDWFNTLRSISLY